MTYILRSYVLGTGSVTEKEFIEAVSQFWQNVSTEEDIVDAFKVCIQT